MQEDAGRGRRTHGRQRAGGDVVLRGWRMPVLTAVLCVSVWPLIIAVLLVPVWVAFGWDSPSGDLALGITAVLLFLCGGVCAVRALRARVVVTADELRVHNVLSTKRFRWAEVEAVEERWFLNASAILKPLWYGTAVRVRGRRRPVGVLASWCQDEERAAALRQLIRPPGSGGGVGSGQRRSLPG
jgi:hypothetical protein